ncbi:hypothetical protein GCM10010302_41890 [Streptomyces polychromogenes]|uniref:Uncharacterized protein n=1 Tax=Streptomyces polychromogenes TaxID=67342 RepID=A0ABN0VGM0_9ACTN
MNPGFVGSEQSRWVCAVEAVGVAGAVEAADGEATASRPPDIRAAAPSTDVAARRVSLPTRLVGFDCNEQPSMGGRIPAAWDWPAHVSDRSMTCLWVCGNAAGYEWHWFIDPAVTTFSGGHRRT